MIVWLASYPRSGNTFFRVVLNSVFEIKTYSLYDDLGDIGADKVTSEIVGHTFLPKDFDLNKARSSNEIYYIKTHELLDNANISPLDKVTYLIRDGRESTVSFAKHRKNYYGKSDELTDVIYGNTPFKGWGEHVMQWSHLNDYLLIKFEEFTSDPSSQLKKIADYLNIQPISHTIPTFNELQKINPTFFRSGKKDSWKSVFTENEHLAFWLRNYEPMLKFGYDTHIPEAVNEDTFQTYRTLFTKEIKALQNNLFIDKLSKQEKQTLKNKLDEVEKQNQTLLQGIEKIHSLSTITSPLKKYQAYQNLLDTAHKYKKGQ